MLFSYTWAARANVLISSASLSVKFLSPFFINASIFFIVALYTFSFSIFILRFAMTRILRPLLLAIDLDSLKVIQDYLIVFFMSTYELYVNGPHTEYYSNNQPILVPFNVENVKIITHCIHRIEHLPQFIEVCPV